MADPIALVGIGCRFPGAPGPTEFWQMLVEGRDAITEVPASRFDLKRYFDPKPGTPGRVASRWGGFLDGLDLFDADFFAIAPREASYIDPQQRLLLEVAWEAFEDAGIVLERTAPTRAGVFVGMWLGDFEGRLFANPAAMDFYKTTGSGRYAASGRISFALGLNGPSMTIDTACSSSLAAVHVACQSLRSGECDVALVGAANVILQPHITIAYSQSNMMAPDGRCKFGDARANGYVRSEGAAALVLKPLDQAVRDGDAVYAVILGSAVNNDGHGDGYLATPSQHGQEDLLRTAYAAAGVEPDSVDYVEAHGTGTRAGDPVEVGALGAVLGDGRSADRPLRVGSVKTNLGHTEGVAGLAGLIKTALALHHGELPASLNIESPNPAIPWDRLHIEVQRERTPWPGAPETRVAGVSAFGITGTNGHVVLQGVRDGTPVSSNEDSRREDAQVLCLSAHAPAALTARASRLAEWLASDEATALGLQDVCRTANVRRAAMEHCLAVVGASMEAMATSLRSFAEDRPDPTWVAGRADDRDRRPAFVFSGQGGQWLGMGRRLYDQEQVFRDAIERCEAALDPHVPWSLTDELLGGTSQAHLDDIEVVQPTLFAVQVALSALWHSWGILPRAVVGHSMGEVAAAHVAGALSLEDAARIICVRSRLMKRTSGQGAMAVVERTWDEAEALLSGYGDDVTIAVSNSPRSTVLSGDAMVLQRILDDLERRDVFCRLVKVDVASHSPQMTPLVRELVENVAAIRPGEASVPLYSTVLGGAVDGRQLGPGYWGTNLRQPVRFSSVIQQMIGDGVDTFIEISPHPILLQPIRECAQEREAGGGSMVVTLPSLRRDEDERSTLLASLGRAFVHGVTVDWRRLYPGPGRLVRLPQYPFQRERFWYDDVDAAPAADVSERRDHAFLGHPVRSALHQGEWSWSLTLSTRRFPFLADHRVRDLVLFPAAAFIELLLAVAADVERETAPETGAAVELEAVRFDEGLTLTEEDIEVQIALSEAGGGRYEASIFSRRSDADGSSAWTCHVTSTVRLRGGESETVRPVGKEEESDSAMMDAADVYEALAQHGLPYGPAFRGVDSLRRAGDRAFARVHVAAPEATGHLPFRVHPVLLDAGFQAAAAAVLSEGRFGSASALPVSAERVSIFADAAAIREAVVRVAVTDAEADGFSVDVTFADDAGQVVAVVSGLRFKVVPASSASALDGLLYRREWIESALAGDESFTPEAGQWFVVAPAENSIISEVAPMLASFEGTSATAVVLGAPAGDEGEGARYAPFVEALSRCDEPVRGVVYVNDEDAGVAGAPDGVVETTHRGVHDLVGFVRILGGQEALRDARLVVVTHSRSGLEADDPSIDPPGAAVWGIGRTIAYEYPEWSCTTIDVDARSDETLEALCREVLADSAERDVLLRAERRYVARLVPHEPEPVAPRIEHVAVGPETSFQLVQDRPGILSELTVRVSTVRAPAPGEVVVEVESAGLNFLDVLKALGRYPGQEPDRPPSLGAECAGRVVAVGRGVEGVAVGDEVVAVSPALEDESCFRSHLTVAAELVARKPESLSFAEAAGLPIVYLTAEYALTHLAQLRPGERVLIHSASGGVGLAAVHLARRVGAEIFATAGTEEKRAYLREFGVRHVMSSRDLSFAPEIMDATGGRGVDVVLNALSGDALRASFSVLAPYGRFVEIGKRDIYENGQLGMAPFRRNLSFFAVDMARVVRERPSVAGAMLRDVMQRIARGVLPGLPVQTFSLGDAVDGFRLMAQAGHIGKIVFDVREGVAVAERVLGDVREDGTHVLTGGHGALGLEVAGVLIERGARSLALLSRSRPGPEAMQRMAEWGRDGVLVQSFEADVTSFDDMERVFREIRQTMPPLRSVFHLAGGLDDGTLAHLTAAQIERVLSPKVDGAWNLHRVTAEDALDHFVMFSSAASVLGLPGQGNYVAANAFVDALAAERRRQGLPATSINWGPWSQVGLAAASADRGQRLQERGLGSLTVRQGTAVLAWALRARPTGIAAMQFDADAWCSSYAAARTPYLERLEDEANDAPALASVDLLTSIREHDDARTRRTTLEHFIRDQVAEVLRMAPEKVDVEKPLRSIGIDSLMTIELRNRLEIALKTKLSATMTWNYPTVVALTGYLAQHVGIDIEGANGPEEGAPGIEDTLSQMSEEDAEALLARKLAALDPKY